MSDQMQEIPKQRGTSSGEIGQNPVEIIGKRPAPPESQPANDGEVKEDAADSKA